MSIVRILQSKFPKGKGFNPSLIARGGIPKEADSVLNPKCIGTPAWESFWNDQLYCIANGISTGGIYIPGRYYYYLNFNSMSTVNGIIAPDMVDLHLELANLIEYCKLNGRNIICAKKRRAGISEFTQKAVADYGWRFTNGAFQCGVAAGLDTFAQDFMKKWRANEALLPPELRVKKLKDNDDDVIAGYKFKNHNGEMINGGTNNRIIVRTMHRDPALFKGLFCNVIIAEECGEFEKLERFYAHSKACLMDGTRQVGFFMYYGTGGAMDKGSKDFKHIWDNADKYNFEKLLITAERFHRPFYGIYGDERENKNRIPNLLKELKPYQAIGMEDYEAAREDILKQREKAKATNPQTYQEHLKDYPLTEADVFKKTVVNAFDTDIMNDQMRLIDTEDKKYLKVKLEYVRDKKTGDIKFPLEVEWSIDNDTPEDGACFLIHKDFLDQKKYRQFDNLFCGAVDGYDQDLSRTSKSKGAMCVLIRRNSGASPLQLAPVATICCRPPRKEQFYEMCLKLAIFFNLHESVLCDVRTPGVIKYFEERNCQKYLAYRPKKFESENSQQTHTWGVSLNNHSKPLMLGLMQAAVDYHCTNMIWFPELLNQLQNFDIAYIGSDNDLGDAYGIALMQDASYEIQPRNRDEWYKDDIFDLGSWTRDSNGDVIPGDPADDRPILSDEHDHPRRFK